MAKKSKKSETDRKAGLAERVLSYPARLAILGGAGIGTMGDQFLYNRGLAPGITSPTIRSGKGYESGKKLLRTAVGIDPLLDDPQYSDAPAKNAKGGAVKKYAKGGSVKSSASKRGDGIAQRGKTKGKMR